MREIFEEIFSQQPLDPVETARRAMRPRLRPRFYKEVHVTDTQSGFAVALDGRLVKTPARRILAAPVRRLAEAIGNEWRAQAETIDPATMPLTRLANSIIDAVADAPQRVAADAAKYLSSDLLFYRAEGPAALVARQSRAWDPLLAWVKETFGAGFVLGTGLVHVAQPEAAVAKARAAIPCNTGDIIDAWRLGAVHSITTLTGSALIALAVLDGRLSADAAWAAANVDEDWNLDTWGLDEQALERRALRLAETRAAAQVLDALRG
ncbi:MAG TPA: ATP12 family protein [Xanthobacteraceae bacterium]|jgi:chaperone required for assembly of F1-ATPase